MCAAMAPSGGRSPYGSPPGPPGASGMGGGPPGMSVNDAAAAAYAYEMDKAPIYDSRGYDVRSRHGPPMASAAAYYPNEEEAHFGPPGTGGYADYGDGGGGGYYQPGPPQRGLGRGGGGAGMGAMGGGFPPYGYPPGQAPPPGVMIPAAQGYVEDEYVTAFSDEEADELDSRMTRGLAGLGGLDPHARSKSMLRHNELERERSRRRQNIVKTKGKGKLFPGRLKLSMMNTGLLPIKKEGDNFTTEFYENPVSIGDFEKHCAQRRKYPVLLQIEFNNAIKEVEVQPTRKGTLKANVEKNQNPRVVPYDFNRVVLEPEEGVPDSDYINASYVDSLVQPKAYIVTQGPTETTIGDFWRMVWQERASCIVMVTRTFDFIRVMCVQYWPAGKNREEVYSGVGVTVENEEQLANFMIRTIRMRKNGEERKVILFHYTEWPCHSNPFSNALLEFRRRVRNVMNHHPDTQDGPVIVHCNDGAGRSGVYIAIDANIELSEEDGVFDVFGYLRKMRGQRRGLIETLSQYKFVFETLLEYTRGIDSRFPVSELANKIKERGIKDKKTKKNAYQMEYEEQLKFVYDTLEEFVMCGYTYFPVRDISQHLKQKSVRKPGCKQNQYEKEYALICNQTPRFTIGDCAAGHRADNRDKNRNVLIVPPDNFRPYITSFQGNNCTDYINAVFVDGYTHPREYIVTEWPLQTTCSDIWSLVYDHDCSALVVLCNPTSTVSNVYPAFWPDSTRSKKYGQVFTVEHVSHKHYPNIRTWVFRINKKIVSLTELMAGVKAPTKTCQLFQLMCWPQGHKVPTSTNSLVELMNMVERWRQETDYGPVVVVSTDGQSRGGVYCAANACIEQVIQHGEVDVFQAVKTVRRHRPQLVENITEYKYCYDLVLHYVLHYLHKESDQDE